MRFTSADPLGNFVANAADPQSWNMYSYVENNPLAFVDPSGTACVYEGADNGTAADYADPTNYVDDNNPGQTCAQAFASPPEEEDVTGLDDGLAYQYVDYGDDTPYFDFSITQYGVTPNQSRSASTSIITFLKSCEGFRSGAYNDSLNNCTIGYGHLLHLGPCTVGESGLHMGRQAATDLLIQDVQSTVNALNNALHAPTTQGQFGCAT